MLQEDNNSAPFRELPWPFHKGRTIFPIFLPYLGCKGQCVFCNQHLQTGKDMITQPEDLDAILQTHESELEQWNHASGKPELAFYGGTFTAIPAWAWRRCLHWVNQLYKRSLISGFRCSTRPDAVDRERILQLQAHGCRLIELGVQSFDNNALGAAARGYDNKQIYAAIETMSGAQIAYGIQLMPGMPGVSPAVFLNDIAETAALKPACARLYPCLVIAGTRLEQLWARGDFAPWPLGLTLKMLAQAWLTLQLANIPVIRMGLAPQAELENAIKAGPVHPALGSRVMGYALLQAVADLLQKQERNKFTLYLPQRTQGYIWGWHGELAEKWAKLGVGKENTRFWSKDTIRLEHAPKA